MRVHRNDLAARDVAAGCWHCQVGLAHAMRDGFDGVLDDRCPVRVAKNSGKGRSGSGSGGASDSDSSDGDNSSGPGRASDRDSIDG